MPSARIVRESAIIRSPRVMQLEGMFDVPPSEQSREEWEVELPLDEQEWNVGLIVGPSGSGKTTIARELFGDAVVDGFDWLAENSIVDSFPAGMSIRDITGLLSSVGFSAPPSWLRPFHVLSTGEQFRATIARAMAEKPDLAVIDEFTSVVDRTVAQIGSAAVAKAVRRNGSKLVAVSCHYDVIEWLQPDWIYRPDADEFSWRSVQPRPRVDITVRRVHHSAWRLFSHHHYLSADLNPAAACFIGFVDEQPTTFVAVLSFPHKYAPGWRISRVVTLPDYQGVGIGNAVFDYVAGLFRATGKYIGAVMTHPALVHRLARSSDWKLRRKPSRNPKNVGKRSMNATVATHRLTAGFEYVGPAHIEDAREFGIL